jgi:hypothetical protein
VVQTPKGVTVFVDDDDGMTLFSELHRKL